MSQSSENIRGSFSYTGSNSLDLKEIREIFGSPKDPMHSSRQRGKDVLWEGLFGFADGPEVVRFSQSKDTLAVNGIAAAAYRNRRSLIGITLGRSRESQVYSDNQGRTLTALSAYITKRVAGDTYAPRIELPYSGFGLGLDDNRLSVKNPFGIANVQAYLHRPREMSGKLTNEDGLFFMGNLSIGGQPGAGLPAVMRGQTAVVGHVLNSRQEAEQAVGLAYGGSLEAVSEAWDQAMALPTPRRAAEHILNTL